MTWSAFRFVSFNVSANGGQPLTLLNFSGIPENCPRSLNEWEVSGHGLGPHPHRIPDLSCSMCLLLHVRYPHRHYISLYWLTSCPLLNFLIQSKRGLPIYNLLNNNIYHLFTYIYIVWFIHTNSNFRPPTSLTNKEYLLQLHFCWTQFSGKFDFIVEYLSTSFHIFKCR